MAEHELGIDIVTRGVNTSAAEINRLQVLFGKLRTEQESYVTGFRKFEGIGAWQAQHDAMLKQIGDWEALIRVQDKAARQTASIGRQNQQISSAAASAGAFKKAGPTLGEQAYLDDLRRQQRMNAARLAEQKIAFDRETRLMETQAAIRAAKAKEINRKLAAFYKEEDRGKAEAEKIKAKIIAAENIVEQASSPEAGRARAIAMYEKEQAAMRRTEAAVARLDAARARAAAAEEKRAARAVADAEKQMGFFARLFSRPQEMKHLIALPDEFMRNQRGQMGATLGAMLRDSGMSAAAMGGGMAAVGGIIAGAAIIHGIENVGKLAANIRAGAAAAGMSVGQFSSLQGALRLMGLNADSANQTLRHFASAMSTAIAEPSSKVAQYFHSIGISQKELTESSGNVEGMFHRVADAMSQYANSEQKAEAETGLFGHEVQRILPLLNDGANKTKELQKKAEELGLTMTETEAKALEETSTKIHELGAAIFGTAIKAFLAWKPAIDGVISSLGALVHAAGSAVTALGKVFEKAVEAQVKVHEAGFSIAMAGGEAYVIPNMDLKSKPPLDTGPKIMAGENIRAFRRRMEGPQEWETSGHEGRGGFGHPKPEVAIDREKQVAKIKEEIALARDNAAIANRGHKPRDIAEAEIKAEMAVRQKHLNDPMLSEAEKRTERADLARLDASLIKSEAAGGAKANSQAYEAFVAEKQNEIREARGNFEEQKRILKEWQDEARKVYGENSRQFQMAKRAELLAARENISEQIHLARTAYSTNEAALREFSSDMRAMQALPRGDPRRINAQQVQGFEIQKAFQLRDETLSTFQNVRSQTTNADQLKTLDAEMGRVKLRFDAQIAEMVAKANEAGSKISKAFSDPLRRAFDGIGSSFEKAFDDIVNGKGLRGAEQTLLKGISSSAINFVGGTASRLAATRVPGANPGEDLGTALSGYLVQLVTGQVVQDTSLAAIAANTGAALPLLAATAAGASTSGVGSALQGAGSAASIAGNAEGIGSFFGKVGSFFSSILEVAALSHGGIMPSAAGGWSLPDFAGGQPALLHSREMVLPADLSQGMQDMIRGGGAGGDTHVHISALDGPSVHKWLMDNGGRGMIADAVRSAFTSNTLTPRNFGPR